MKIDNVELQRRINAASEIVESILSPEESYNGFLDEKFIKKLELAMERNLEYVKRFEFFLLLCF